MSNGLDPDQDRHYFTRDLGPIICKGHQQTIKAATNKGRVRGLIEILTLAYVATLSTTRDQTSEFIPVGASNITEIMFKEFIS